VARLRPGYPHAYCFHCVQPRNGPRSAHPTGLVRTRGVQMKVLKWTAATWVIAVGTILLLSKNDIQRIVRMHAM
jgi:hypothetical protein